jgi:hypothetical protein
MLYEYGVMTMEKQKFTFEQWCKELSRIAFLMGYTYDLVENTGPDCWRDYFNEDSTPADALAEDHRHAQ